MSEVHKTKSISQDKLYTASEKQLKYLADIERKLHLHYHGDYSTLSVSDFLTRHKEEVKKWDAKHRHK